MGTPENSFIYLFLFFGGTHSIWKFLGQGLNLSGNWDLCHSYGNARSLTDCATAETPKIVLETRKGMDDR